MRIRLNILTVGLLLLSFIGLAQNADRFKAIEQELEAKAKSMPALNKPVNISVNHYTLQEIIRAVALENGLNVSVDASLVDKPSYNFSNASVKEVFLFLCKEHDLYIDWTGNILAFKKYIKPAEEPVRKKEKLVNLTYDKATGKINADLLQDTLYRVTRKLSILSGKNIQVDPALHDMLVTLTIVDQQMEDVLTRLAGANDSKKLSDNYFTITKADKAVTSTSRRINNRRTNNGRRRSNKKGLIVDRKDSTLSVLAYNVPLNDIIAELSDKAEVNFFLFKQPKGNLTLNIQDKPYEEILSYLLNTSDFTYKYLDSVYVIGERKDESLRYTTTYQMKYRTVDEVVNVIPTDLKKNVDIKEFIELNSIIMSGSQPQIKEIEAFLKKIDQTVPVVLIEVVIADVKKSHTISTGLKIGQNPDITSTGSLNNNNDGIQVSLDANMLNTIIQSITNLGIFNLGNVGNGFYLQMSALEENGNLKMRSTPKLATLNGHEANMSIGETKYYPIDQTNVIGAQSPQVITSRIYKSVNADLAVTIKPMVSGNDQITLEITVSQSTFGKQEGEAPPEYEKREFKSLIRMKNQEMVVLGGLEQNRKSDSGSGVPLLSRIPIIKWFFSNRTKEKEEAQLTIFIRPTIIY